MGVLGPETPQNGHFGGYTPPKRGFRGVRPPPNGGLGGSGGAKTRSKTAKKRQKCLFLYWIPMGMGGKLGYCRGPPLDWVQKCHFGGPGTPKTPILGVPGPPKRGGRPPKTPFWGGRTPKNPILGGFGVKSGYKRGFWPLWTPKSPKMGVLGHFGATFSTRSSGKPGLGTFEAKPPNPGGKPLPKTRPGTPLREVKVTSGTGIWDRYTGTDPGDRSGTPIREAKRVTLDWVS